MWLGQFVWSQARLYTFLISSRTCIPSKLSIYSNKNECSWGQYKINTSHCICVTQENPYKTEHDPVSELPRSNAHRIWWVKVTQRFFYQVQTNQIMVDIGTISLNSYTGWGYPMSHLRLYIHKKSNPTDKTVFSTATPPNQLHIHLCSFMIRVFAHLPCSKR